MPKALGPTETGVMKEEMFNLKNQLAAVTKERNLLHEALGKIQIRMGEEVEKRMRSQAAGYESRLIELHSVIAELKKNLDISMDKRIPEERLSEGDEDDQESSKNSQGSSSENSSKSINEETIEDSNTKSCQVDKVRGKRRAEEKHNNVTQLYEEVAEVREEHRNIRETLRKKEVELERSKGALESIGQERDFLRHKVSELESLLKEKKFPSKKLPPDDDHPFQLKIAEKVKLKTQAGKPNSNLNHNNNRFFRSSSRSQGFISGQDVMRIGFSPRVAEVLSEGMKEESRVREMEEALSPSSSNASLAEERIREFEVETERLKSRLEHYKAQNEVLTLNLEDSKNLSHRLTVLLGKYESNNLALQISLDLSDQGIEAYDILVALLESELGQLLANCRAAGIGCNTEGANGEQLDVPTLLHRANENRETAETAARNLLLRFGHPPFPLDSPGSENNNMGLDLNSTPPPLHPWEENSSGSQTLSSASTSSVGGSSHSGESFNNSFEKSEEGRIRDVIIGLKTEREGVRRTVLSIDSWGQEPHTPDEPSPCDLIEARKLDLETAVLMQELMAMREEKAELRAQLFLNDKDRHSLELRLGSYEAQDDANKSRIAVLKEELKEALRKKKSKRENLNEPRNDNSPDEDEENGNEREEELRRRVKDLLGSLERVSTSAMMREKEEREMTSELRRANANLVENLEATKRKYQGRLKKMEDQILSLMDRHSSQIKLYREKLAGIQPISCNLNERNFNE